MPQKSSLFIFRKALWVTGALALLAAVLTACAAQPTPTQAPGSYPLAQVLGEGSGVRAEPAAVEPTPTPLPTAAPTATPEALGSGSTEPVEASLRIIAESGLGEYLADGKGMTLYIYTEDEPDKSSCTGDCLVKWPPLLTLGSPVLGAGVDEALVGTTTLPDGRLVVTYNQMPLYYWSGDQKPTDALGQGVGGVWYAVRFDGVPITE